MIAPKLSHLAETLISSEIVRLGAIIKEKISNGEEIYNYTIGDFDSGQFPIPELLQQEIISAYQTGLTTYPAAEGELALRKAVSGFIQRNEQLNYSAQEILIAAGGRPLIYAIYRAIVDKGDKVIYPTPSWNNNHYVHFTEGEHVVVEATRENNFMPTADQIRPHVKGATLIALCSPLNPTGTTFSKAELEAICNLIVEENKTRGDDEKKLYLLYDQIYWTLTFGETIHYNPVSLNPKMKDYTVFVDGISKSFAATGVRVGWALAPTHIILKMRAINSHIGCWAPMAEQHAVANFLNNDKAVTAYLTNMRSEIAERLNKIYDGFKKLKDKGFKVEAVAPQAAIYLTVQLDLTGSTSGEGLRLANQSEVTSYILNKANLALVPFYAFGTDKENTWYRLSVGRCKKEEINDMLMKLEKALEGLS